MQINADELAHRLAQEGASGSYSPRPGITVHYEWKDGTCQANMTIDDEQWQTAMEYCKLFRDNESTLAPLKAGINGATFLFWDYVDVYLQAKGLDYHEVMREHDSDQLLEIYKVIETELPAFKLTNRRLWIPRESRKKV